MNLNSLNNRSYYNVVNSFFNTFTTLLQRKTTMNPNIVWKIILEHRENNELELAVDHILNLQDWLLKGGFEPRNNFDAELFLCMVNWVRGGCQRATSVQVVMS